MFNGLFVNIGLLRIRISSYISYVLAVLYDTEIHITLCSVHWLNKRSQDRDMFGNWFEFDKI